MEPAVVRVELRQRPEDVDLDELRVL